MAALQRRIGLLFALFVVLLAVAGLRALYLGGPHAATLRRAAVLANGPLVDIGDLRLEPPPLPAPAAPRMAPRPVRARVLPRPKPGSEDERGAILQALQDSGFNMTRTAQLLGVARATLYRMLRRNRIELGQHYLLQPGEPESEP